MSSSAELRLTMQVGPLGIKELWKEMMDKLWVPVQMRLCQTWLVTWLVKAAQRVAGVTTASATAPTGTADVAEARRRKKQKVVAKDKILHTHLTLLCSL